jgi:predicted RecA/RadA family phage recombinase
MTQATFIQDGKYVDHTPLGALASGDVVVQGDLVGVVVRPLAVGELGALVVDGVFDFAKEAGGGVTFAVGAIAYWDDTNNVAVATDGAGANKQIGKVVKVAADADATVRVRLSQ